MGRWLHTPVLFPALTLAVVVGLPATGFAGNGTHPRTPVKWDDVPCATTIDRSIDPIFLLPYSIPYEDTEVTPDEVEDSRSHQFFAFCQDFDPTSVPPPWITDIDVEAAAAKGLAEPDKLTANDILESNMNLDGCWWRITADDERRPITFDMASDDVEWNTSVVDPGVYKIYGYTYEPAFNLWSKRPGFVRVVDDPDPALIGPAVAGSFDGEPIFFRNDTGELRACVDAMPGSTLSGHWSIAAAGVTPVWVPFGEAVTVETGTHTLQFPVPAEAAGQSIMIRMNVEDPEGRVYSAYVPDIVVILASDRPGGCDDDDCEDGDGTAGDGDDDGQTDSDAGAKCMDEDDNDDGNCTGGCRVTDLPSAPGGWLVALWVFAIRRRRRS